MIKNKIFILTTLLFLLLAIIFNNLNKQETTNYKIKDKSYKLLVADSPKEWERGLMDIRKLNNADGMIFLFPDKKRKRLILLSIAVMALGLLATFSRIFIVLFLVGLGLILFFNRPKNFKDKRWPALLAITSVSSLLVLAVVFIRPVGEDQSFNLRVLYEKTANAQISSSPVWGQGPGQSVLKGNEFLKAELVNADTKYEPWMHEPAHNSYLLLAAETGWAGLTIFLIFILATTDNMLKLLRKVQKEKYNKIFVFASIASFAIILGMFVEHLFITNPSSLYLTSAVFALLTSSKTECLGFVQKQKGDKTGN